MPEHDVVIAGAGPTGLMLAAELAIAGVDVAIVERRVSPDLTGARAGGLHPRTLEELDQRGIVDRFLGAGRVARAMSFALIPLDLGGVPTRHDYVLALEQAHIERLLADWVAELGVPIRRGCEVTGFVQDDAGVDIMLDDGESLRARYLVGCDGGRSCVRKVAGIEFSGTDATTSSLLAEVELAVEPPTWGVRRDEVGIHSLSRIGHRVRVLVTERHARRGEPTLGDLADALVAAYGTDFGVHGSTWISRFTDATRQAAQYRRGRVLLAGDAAHVHPPDGGQGLQTGMQDAVNLGWKLAQVVKGISPEALLDTYHEERHPVGARVIANALAAVALRRFDDRTKALHGLVAELLGMDEPRKRLAAKLSGLAIRYDLGAGHPLLGRRMPDVDLVGADGAPLRAFKLLHAARPVLLDLDRMGFDVAPWADRVCLVVARHEGAWELPAVGPIAAPKAVLIRPDGYVAWVGEGTAAGLADALTAWFGPPHAA